MKINPTKIVIFLYTCLCVVIQLLDAYVCMIELVDVIVMVYLFPSPQRVDEAIDVAGRESSQA